MLNRLQILSFKRAFPFPQSRSYAKSGPPSAIPGDGEYKDFRPPWVYLATHILTYTLIPSVALYCVFIKEWPQEDHVFMPPRRWLARQKANFFSLSPAEQELAKSDEDRSKHL